MTDNSHKIILDLCGGTGAWSAPYREAGYDVRLVTLPEWDVRDFRRRASAMYPAVHGILAAPPCDHFASSGARWWKEKDADGRTQEGIEIAKACLDIIQICRPAWYAIENPIGRFRRLVMGGQSPRLTFDPRDYGDPWTKRTQVWGKFNLPTPRPVVASEGSKVHRMSSTWKVQRSITPPGFARAFFEANP